MLISPRVAIQNGWITHHQYSNISDWENNKNISPNAIDFTLDRVYAFGDNDVVISETGKTMATTTQIEPVVQTLDDNTLYFHISGKEVYDGMSDFYVNVPEGVVCIPMIVRSTLNRNGIILTSGLYDSGYRGHIGFVIHNRRHGSTYIAAGTRVGQIAFVQADSAGMYLGGWNHKQGTHYTDNNVI